MSNTSAGTTGPVPGTLGDTLNHRKQVFLTCGVLRKLTLGLLVFARRPPADAGLVFIQKEEPDQTFGAAAELHHLGPQLHGVHAFLH